ncbi:alkaline phosphatase [Methylotenera sp.]|uniref:alkaline phosphatase n=1 Tax=Methylotenera sp. TaxID=2051956 RepID=UPI002488B0C2|nr:alkaline phosphatase [Methylotenera sp.]MDI1299048.1 alkaline phosphatase [Methylotenera sp.]
MKQLTLKATTLAVIMTFATPFAFAEDANTWLNDGAASLAAAKKLVPNVKRAKNVILFVGDGMGISTVTAARIFEGQQKGLDGERNKLAFEKLPYVALSKTYSANQQTSDSAPTMTAIVSGVKTNDGELSINQSVVRSEPSNAVIQANKVATILEQAEISGRATGIVSTARLTHATPAATYAHTSNRDWEANANLPAAAVNGGVKDIAAQMIDNFGAGGIGDGLEVALGGGRTYYLPNTAFDPEYTTTKGRRTDGRNLTTEFTSKFGGEYVWNKAQFDAINPASTTKLLGLFEPSHMQYDFDRPADTAGEPSLAEMTDKAIDVLKNNPKGYFLMVEGGRIDHASHAGNAYRTLSDAVAFSDAVKKALEKVDLNDTLVIVTADHSHTLTIAGYPKRGNPILGKVVSPGKTTPDLATDGKPYTTIGFANGVGYYQDQAGDAVYNQTARAGRIEDMTAVNTEDPNFHQEVTVPLQGGETHAGEDVAIFAGGPKAYLMQGVQEQSYIYQVMKDAFGF